MCGACARVWPVVRGIPRFVGSEHYAGNFGFEWRRHRKTQFDSVRSRTSERELIEKTGLTPEDVRGKLVLDVGVGTGRYADVIARWGGRVVGIDLSQAVLTARGNLARYGDRALVAQADLFHLPFREQAFDIVYSIGVLHHTPSTREAFRAVARFAKPGGIAAIAVYRYDDFLDFSGRYRRYTVPMSHSWLHFLCHGAIPAYHFIRAAWEFLDPLWASRVEKVFMIGMHEDPAWRVLNTFDWYSPRFQWLHTEENVKRWFEELGFEEVRALPEQSMHSVRGRRGVALVSPPPSVEERRNELASPPAWIPSEPGPLRDLVLTVLVAGAMLRAIDEIRPRPFAPVITKLRAAISAAVVRAKSILGIDGDLLGRSSPGA